MQTATVDITSGSPSGQPTWRPEASIIVLSTAELVDCTCPDWCERDHDRD